MTINALKLRQTLGKVLDNLDKNYEPLIVERGRKPIAVLISYKVFLERFIDWKDNQKKKMLIERFKRLNIKSEKNSLKTLRSLRYED